MAELHRGLSITGHSGLAFQLGNQELLVKKKKLAPQTSAKFCSLDICLSVWKRQEIN